MFYYLFEHILTDKIKKVVKTIVLMHNIISVNLEKKINVPSGCFSPKPKVDSGFIVLTRKKFNLNIDSYLRFIKCSFANKRKTLINSLINSNFEKVDKVKNYLIKNKIKLNIRSEEIEIEQFIEIFSSI